MMEEQATRNLAEIEREVMATWPRQEHDLAYEPCRRSRYTCATCGLRWEEYPQVLSGCLGKTTIPAEQEERPVRWLTLYEMQRRGFWPDDTSQPVGFWRLDNGTRIRPLYRRPDGAIQEEVEQ